MTKLASLIGGEKNRILIAMTGMSSGATNIQPQASVPRKITVRAHNSRWAVGNAAIHSIPVDFSFRGYYSATVQRNKAPTTQIRENLQESRSERRVNNADRG
jgi:hypothetical protein